MRGDMAAIKNSNKTRVYHSLFQINRALNAVVTHCRTLGNTGILPASKMRVLAGLTRELQSQISHDVADRMHDVEDAEMFRWEKVRIAMEKSLKGKI
jgi:hypothetical protein